MERGAANHRVVHLRQSDRPGTVRWDRRGRTARQPASAAAAVRPRHSAGSRNPRQFEHPHGRPGVGEPRQLRPRPPAVLPCSRPRTAGSKARPSTERKSGWDRRTRAVARRPEATPHPPGGKSARTAESTRGETERRAERGAEARESERTKDGQKDTGAAATGAAARPKRPDCGAAPLRSGAARPQEAPQEGYLVDPASSHMLVSKIKPCMSK